MAETEPTQTVPESAPQSEGEHRRQTRWQSFTDKHPRASAVAALTGVVTAAATAVAVGRNAIVNRDKLAQAGELAGDALTGDVTTPESPSEA